jgi:hypothetical protein
VCESGNYAAYDALHPGVPSWLRSSLWRWVAARLPTEDDLLRVERRFRFELVDPRYGRDGALSELQNRAFNDAEFFLDVVDFLLSQLDPRLPPSDDPFYADRRADRVDMANLAKMLNEAGSLWRVGQRTNDFNYKDVSNPS